MGFLSRLFHLNVPATVDEGVITVPSFTIPLEELPEPCAEGTIAVKVEPEKKVATVKVALVKKKIATKKPTKKVPKKAK